MRRLRAYAWLGAFAVVLVIVPFGVRYGTIRPTYFQQVIDLALIWSIVTVSLALLAGIAGQISLGQGAFMAVGAYLTALLTAEAGWPIWAALLVGVVASGVSGIVVGLPALRLRGPYLVMATLAFAGIAYGVARNWVPVTHGPQGVRGIPTPMAFGLPVDSEFRWHFVLAVALLACLLIVTVMRNSQRGLRMRAVRDDVIAAEAIGIRSAYERTAAFAASAAMAGLAGGLMSLFIGFISPDFFTIDQSVLVLTMALVGGIASLAGVIGGAFALVALTEALRDFAEYQLVMYGLAVLVVVTLVPDGAAGAITTIARRGRGYRARRQRLPVPRGEVADAARG